MERAALVQALRSAGPQAPTLCEGWTAHDLAAHVWLREREPVAALGSFVAPLADRTQRRMEELKTEKPFDRLVDAFAVPPGRFSPFGENPVGDLVNGVEYFIHCEDVRRGVEPWEPRPLDEATRAWLWSSVRQFARARLARSDPSLVLEDVGTGDAIRVGRGRRIVTVVGEPGELLLMLSGRLGAARLTFYGDPDVVLRVKETRLRL